MSYFVGCSTFVRLVAAASYLARRPERNCNDRNVSNRCRSCTGTAFDCVLSPSHKLIPRRQRRPACASDATEM